MPTTIVIAQGSIVSCPSSNEKNISLSDEERNPLSSHCIEEQRIQCNICNRGKQTRAGTRNYCTEDVETLLDIVRNIEKLGANQSALVANKYEEWVQLKSRPQRDQESLQDKFEKRASAKKKLVILFVLQFVQLSTWLAIIKTNLQPIQLVVQAKKYKSLSME